MRARVFVTLKPSVFDPQGRTIVEALRSLGYAKAQDVRQGKYFELDLATGDAAEARRLVDEVLDAGDALVVRNKGREERIPLADIAADAVPVEVETENLAELAQALSFHGRQRLPVDGFNKSGLA